MANPLRKPLSCGLWVVESERWAEPAGAHGIHSIAGHGIIAGIIPGIIAGIITSMARRESSSAMYVQIRSLMCIEYLLYIQYVLAQNACDVFFAKMQMHSQITAPEMSDYHCNLGRVDVRPCLHSVHSHSSAAVRFSLFGGLAGWQ